jgi:hypothetical protein
MAKLLVESEVERKIPLRCFSLYADYPAGIRAKRLSSQLAAVFGCCSQFSSELWKLDSVAPVGPIRKMIAQEAGEADVLLLAVSSNQPDAALRQWLKSLIPWKSNRLVAGLLVGLLGDEENQVNDTNWLVQELTAFAQRTGMRLVWQAAGRDSLYDCDWLVSGVECLLHRKQVCAVASVIELQAVASEEFMRAPEAERRRFSP